MSEKELKRIEIPRRTYRLPAREIERMAEEIKGGLDGDGKGIISFYHPIDIPARPLNEEKLAVQLKVTIHYKEGRVFMHQKCLTKPGVKSTYLSCINYIERIEWLPEGLLIVPYGTPYKENPDLLIVPDDGVERMCIYEICPLMVGDEWPDCKTCPYADGTEGDERVTDYMPYEQCNRCRLDHCCWSNGSFIWEDGNTPNDCKEFMPEEEE